MFSASYLTKIIRTIKTLPRYRSESACAVFNGKEFSKKTLLVIKGNVDKWIADGKRRPHLAVVNVGDDPASLSYIKIKSKAAQTVGISSEVIKLKSGISQNDLISLIKELNNNENVDGILVQLPLPPHLDEFIVSNEISPMKDVDGFTQANMGKLCMNSSFLVPCTALAVYHVIEDFGIETAGKHALVCGRSKNVGLPIVLMLHSSRFKDKSQGMNMTTTLCHRFTPRDQLKRLAIEADIIISAAGIPGLITGDMVKDNAVVIDLGMTRIDNQNKKATFIGDVAFQEVKEKASYITPVPGGVGPVTVAMLMKNTLKAAKLHWLTLSEKKSLKSL